jgi:hypothetical protein
LSKLQIDTSKSLYPPITFDVDGQTYAVKKLNRKSFVFLKDIEKRLNEGDATAVYDEIIELTNMPADLVNEMDVEDLRAVARYITDETKERGKPDEEKNEPKPGDAALVS